MCPQVKNNRERMLSERNKAIREKFEYHEARVAEYLESQQDKVPFCSPPITVLATCHSVALLPHPPPPRSASSSLDGR